MATAKRPNVMIFMTDHQRGDTVLPGARAILPNVARLRRDGVVFTGAFCPSPHCCPSRATFMTGLYPSRHGVWNNVDTGNPLSRGLAPGIRTWGEDFRDAGYRMAYSGKWHVSHTESPADRGWRCAPGTEADYSARGIYGSDRWETYRKLAADPEPAARPVGGVLTPGWPGFRLYGEREGPDWDERTVEAGLVELERLLGESADGPWCLFTGVHGPHDPYVVPRRFLDMYPPGSVPLPANASDTMEDKPAFYRRTRDLFAQLPEGEHQEALRHYLAYCSYEDALFGRLLDALDRSQQAENTIVLFLSDHGDYAGEHGLWAKGLPCFRGAYHVPLVVRWPAGIARPGRAVDPLVSLADIAPTLLEAAGIGAPRPFAGASLVPLLLGEEPAGWRDTMFTQTNGNELYGIQRAAFTRDTKFVYNGFDYDELYDLEADPGETRNLARDPARRETIRGFMRRIWRFAHANGDTCINPYIMVRFAQYGPAEAFREGD